MRKQICSHCASATLLTFLAGIVLSGCSLFSTIGGWFSQGYENTTAYFNAYYNAKRLFAEAENEVLTAALAARGKSMQPAQATPVSGTAKQKFTQVIDKCSHILSFYQQSAVVDDALFLIGKSYFYQGEYIRAERKFSELVAQYPTGPLRFDGQLWFVRTLERLNRFDDAIVAGEALARDANEASEEDIAGEAHALLGTVLRSQNLPQRAIEEYTRATEVSGDGLLQAQAQTKIGDILASLQDYEEAAAAYLKVTEYAPDIYLAYYSRLEAVRAFRNLGRYDTAVALLRELEDDYRFGDYSGTIRLELGITHARSERLEDALQEFQYVDTTYARTEMGGTAAFELGKLLQYHYGKYAEAKTAYTHAAANTQLLIAPEAQRRAAAITKYFELKNGYGKTDSVLSVADIDSLWISIDTVVNRRVVDTVAAAADTLVAPTDSAAAVVDSTSVATVADSAVVPTDSVAVMVTIRKPSRDSLAVVLSDLAFQLGELFYSDLEIPDSAYSWFSQSLSLHVDSTRAPRTLFVMAEIARTDPDRKYGDEKGMYAKVIEGYPFSRYADQARIALGIEVAASRPDPAVRMYAEADSLVEARQYDDALQKLGVIATEHASSPYAAKSRYTMGWIYEHFLANPDSAVSQYRQVAERFGSTEYGVAALRRIPPSATPSDSTARAPADTTVKPPGQKPLDQARRPDRPLDEETLIRKTPPDSSKAVRGGRKVIVD